MVTGASTADLAHHPRRCPAGRRRADPAPRLHRRRCCGVPHLVVCSQQDGPRRLGQAVYERIRDEFTTLAARLDVPDVAVHPDQRAARRQRRDPLGTHALVRRAAAPRPPRDALHRVRPQPDRLPVPGPVGHPARRRDERTATAATPARSRRRLQAGRRGGRPAVRPDDDDHLHRHLRRPARRGLPAAGGDDPPGRRHRPLAGRHDLPRRTTVRTVGQRSTPWSAG